MASASAPASSNPYTISMYGILLERLLLASKQAEIKSTFQVDIDMSKDKNEIVFKAFNPMNFYRNNFMGYIQNLLRPDHRLKLRNVHIPDDSVIKNIPEIEKAYPGIVLCHDTNKNAFLIQGGDNVWDSFMNDIHEVLKIEWEYFSNSRKAWVKLNQKDQALFRSNLASTTYFVIDSGSDVDLQINLSTMVIVDESGNNRNLRTILTTQEYAAQISESSKYDDDDLRTTFAKQNHGSVGAPGLEVAGTKQDADRDRSPLVHFRHDHIGTKKTNYNMPPPVAVTNWNLFAQFPRLEGVPLRKVIIHGTNVALSYGARSKFNTKGISLMVDYFKSCGVTVMVSLPKFRTFKCTQSPPLVDEGEVIKAFSEVDLFLEIPKGMDEYITAVEFAFLSNSIIISEKTKMDEVPPHLVSYATSNTFTYRFDADRIFITREVTRRLHFDEAIPQKRIK